LASAASSIEPRPVGVRRPLREDRDQLALGRGGGLDRLSRERTRHVDRDHAARERADSLERLGLTAPVRVEQVLGLRND
jgi:hypothetical protein